MDDWDGCRPALCGAVFKIDADEFSTSRTDGDRPGEQQEEREDRREEDGHQSRDRKLAIEHVVYVLGVDAVERCIRAAVVSPGAIDLQGRFDQGVCEQREQGDDPQGP